MNEESLFHLAIGKPAHERTAFLDFACGEDSELRRRVERLLHAHENPGSFLQEPILQLSGMPGDATQALEPGKATPASREKTLAEQGRTLDDDLSFLVPSARPDAIGRLEHYHVLQVIGKGGFGTVLKAFDEKLHRVVAIKVLSPELAASGTARQRFIREARSAAAVTHEHVVTIHAVVEEHRPPYLVMQLIDGVTLQEKLDKNGTLGLREILRIGMQMAEGLAAAHKQGLVHRDIKPANILLENGVERVKITDFGLAKIADDASVTQSGVVAGTPMYMSPEQANGEPLDHRSDLFSLGTVLYVMCTGRPPFRASGTMGVLKRVIEDAPRPVREINPEIPDWLVDIINKLHAKKPADRYQTAREVAELLGQRLADVQAGRAIEARAEPRKGPVDAPATALATPPLTQPGSPRRSWLAWLGLFTLAVLGVCSSVSGAILLATPQSALTEQGRLFAPIQLLGGLSILGLRVFFGSRRSWLRWSAGTCAILLGLAAPVSPLVYQRVFPRPPPMAQLVIQTLAPNVRVEVIPLDEPTGRLDFPPQEAVGVLLDKRVPVGDWRVIARRGDKIHYQTEFALTANVQKFITIPESASIEPLAPEPGWVQLFNGKDLTGWHEGKAAAKNAWTVANDILKGQSVEQSMIWTDRADFKDFHLRVKARIDAKTDSGVNFRNAGVTKGYQADINASMPAGSLWRGADVLVKPPGEAIKANEWFTLEVIAQGSRIKTIVNGRTAADVADSTSLEGRFALQISGKGGSVEFEKIEIKDLPPLPAAAHLLTSDEYEWTEPKNLGPKVNSASGDGTPWVSADGLTLLFASNRPGGLGDYDLWQCTRSSVEEDWSEPLNLGAPINSKGFEIQAAMSADARTLVFTAAKPGGQGEMDLWMATRTSKDAVWGDPVNLGAAVNSPTNDQAPILSDDGLQLSFMSLRDGVYKGWISKRTSVNDAWSRSELFFDSRGSGLQPLDSGKTILCSPDNQRIGLAAWNAADKRWGSTEILPAPINDGNHNTRMFYLASTQTLYFESDRPGGQGKTDLWMSRRVEKPAKAKNEFTLIREFEESHPGTVHAIAVTPDGRHVLSGSINATDRSVLLHDRATGKLVYRFDSSKEGFGIAISKDGRRAVVSARMDLCIYDLPNRKLLHKKRAHENVCFRVAISPDGKYVLTGSGDKTAAVWELETGEEVARIPLSYDCWAAAFMPDGKIMLGGWADPGVCELWDWKNRKRLSSWRVPAWIKNIDLAPDGRSMLVCGHAGLVRLFDLASSRHWDFEGHNGIVWSVKFLPDGRHCISGGEDGTCRVWSLESKKVIASQSSDKRIFNTLAVTPDGREVVAGGGFLHEGTEHKSTEDYALRLWKLPESVWPTPPPAVAPFDAEKAKEHQDAWAKHLGAKVEITNAIGMKLRLIPPGTFLMGAPKEEIDEFANKPPATTLPQLKEFLLAEPAPRQVTLDQPFYLGSHEITVGQFRQFVKETDYKTEAELTGGGVIAKEINKDAANIWSNPNFAVSEKHPVGFISVEDAQAFCIWLSRKEGRRYVLPREDQWEFACRAGTTSYWWFGNDSKRFPANETDRNAALQPVGSVTSNPFGLFDMHGNVAEPCLDADDQPFLRGNRQHLALTRSAARGNAARQIVRPFHGFRVALVGDLTAKPTLEEGWAQLFNGVSMKGWTARASNDGTWSVERGVLKGTARGANPYYVYSERTDLDNFHLRMKAQLNPGGGGRITFRSKDNQIATGLGVTLEHKKAGELTVSAFNAKSVKKVITSKNAKIGPDHWFDLEIIANGQTCEVKLDGVSVYVHTYAKDEPAKDRANVGIVLQVSDAFSVFSLSKIEIKEMPAEPSEKKQGD